MTTRTEPPANSWKRRLKSLVYLGVGSLFGLFAMGLIWAVKDMDDYYYVPHACECLECLHRTTTAPDGRVHCAKYPPKDIKEGEVSAGYVVFCQVAVGFFGVSGLGCSALTAGFGVQGLLRPKSRLPQSQWQVRIRRSAPLGAVLFSASALLFLWPYGIVPR